jgi:type IV secretory pathway TraG/TraD family ATPase VirD4
MSNFRKTLSRKLVVFFCIWCALSLVATEKQVIAKETKFHSQYSQQMQNNNQVQVQQKKRDSLEEEGARQVEMFYFAIKWLNYWGKTIMIGLITLIVSTEIIKFLWRRGFFEPRRLMTKSIAHGSARFARRKEIKHLFRTVFNKRKAGEILVGEYQESWRPKHKLLYLDRDVKGGLAVMHTLVLAPSGAGKSRSIFIPNCYRNNGSSFIATDPKSELWSKTSGTQSRAIRFAPREPDKSECFNFVAACRDYAIAERVAMAIVRSEKAGIEDSFWTENEQSLLTATILHVAQTSAPTPTHMYELLCSGGERLTKVLIDSPVDAARREAGTFEELEQKTKTGILQGIVSKLRWLEDKNVRRFTSSKLEVFDFSKLRKEPIQVYWCLKENDVTALQKLTKIFFNLAMVSLKEIEVEKEKAIPVNLYFDEFANIGKLIDFDKDITLVRDKGIGIIAGLQSISQLVTIYGKSEADTIFANFGNKIILHGLEEETAERISKLMGSYTHTEIKGGRSERGGLLSSNLTTTENTNSNARRLMMADEIRKLDEKKLILISTNLAPIILNRYVPEDEPVIAKVAGCSKEIEIPKYERMRPRTNENNRGMPDLPDLPNGLDI